MLKIFIVYLQNLDAIMGLMIRIENSLIRFSNVLLSER